MNKKQAIKIAMGVLLAAGITACGNLKPSLTPEQLVGQRAQARVDAMITGDFATAYSFYTPGYRSAVAQEDFIVRFKISKVKWTGAKLAEVNCAGIAVCSARVDIDYFVDEPLRGVSEFRNTRRIGETWINIDDQWYFVDES